MITLNDYLPIVGQATLDDLKFLGEKLQGKKIQQINSTAVGGGVAEILNRMIPLFQEIGVDCTWDVIKGGQAFFGVTKKFHNALHGNNEKITPQDLAVFLETSENNIQNIPIYGDIVFIHDPQPIALIKKKTENKWIWRCHIDISLPQKNIWDFLLPYIEQYDSAVFSAPSFSPILNIKQYLISPSIDPISEKNKPLSAKTIDKVLAKYGIIKDKPIITQISRFDRLKDPIGVIKAYKLVKKHIDCQLILAGGTADDDPEGVTVLAEVQELAKNDPDIHILLLAQNDLEINALQRASDVILQKSLKEGFGLTVAEALWKNKPVVASNVGGIPLQINDQYSGILSNSIEGTAHALKTLLNNPGFAQYLGKNGHEHIKNNFLITKHLKYYLLLFLSLNQAEDIVYL